MLKALRYPPIALLWCGQALSSIGDEIYRVALIWLAVGLIGPDTGYLSAAQCAALLVFSLLGGKWADRWDHFKTLINVDLLRGLIVLTPVVVARFWGLSLPSLIFVALSISALGAFFDPALQAMLPRFSPDRETLQAANGLMSTTMRLARVAAPSVIGLLTALIPTVHFFTLDAVSFGISAASIFILRSLATPEQRVFNAVERMSFAENITSGFKLIRARVEMPYAVFAKSVTSGTWGLSYGLGLALLVHQVAPGNVLAFGLLVGAYGLGNLAAALYFGNVDRKVPERMFYKGFLVLGAGFLAIGLAPSLKIAMIAAAIAAIGGPMNDLPFNDLVLARYPVDDIAKVFRLKLALETGALLLCMLVSPLLFRVFSIKPVIGACGLIIFVTGWGGLVLEKRRIAGMPSATSA